MIINPVISTSGGLKPQIIVTAPTGSTVTCTTPGGITIRGVEVIGTWTFADLPGLGTYTISASMGAQSETGSVIVDRVAKYTVNIKYRFYLYNLGDECTDVTGGYGFLFAFSSSYAQQNSKKESNHLEIVAQGSSGASWCRTWCASLEKVDFTNYSKLYIENSVEYGSTSDRSARVYLLTARSTEDSATKSNLGAMSGTSTRSEKLFDVSDITGSYYVCPGVWGYGTPIHRAHVYKIWLV